MTVAVAAVLVCAQSAAAAPRTELLGVTPLGSEVQRFHYRYGPLYVPPGGNMNLIGPVTIEKPPYDGYAVRIKPDMVRADGSVPNVDVIHLHHGVFVNLSRDDTTNPGLPERFFGTGEEKTIFQVPRGYGYPVRRSDVWAFNHMLHNQTPVAETVYVTYDVDFIPKDSELGRKTRPVTPVWMDVRNGEQYPVFDVRRADGGRDGRFVYPNDKRPYGNGRKRNEWRVPRAGKMVATAGHVHPGGLWTDLHVVRGRRRFRAFRSKAIYYDPNGPISWDLSMEATQSRWRVGLKKGDKLRISSAYETKRASWYESMGINVAYVAFGSKPKPDPFNRRQRRRIRRKGLVTHGHLKENENHGGTGAGSKDARKRPNGTTLDRRVGITGFVYTPGDLGAAGPFGFPPTIAQGQRLRFDNADSPEQIYHTITSCKAPCDGATGISYPLANGPVDFDSAELGYGPEGTTAAANRSNWSTPPDLKAGTYTYFCRVHPFMRGAFRVKKQ